MIPHMKLPSNIPLADYDSLMPYYYCTCGVIGLSVGASSLLVVIESSVNIGNGRSLPLIV